MRTCTDCGETKPREAFTPIKGTHLTHTRCKPCRAARARAGRPKRERKPHTAEGMRVCLACGQVKPLDDFTTNGVKYRKTTCKSCRATQALAAYSPASKSARESSTQRTCTECGQTKPLDAFLPIKRWPEYVYGRCRTCRNRRARERYHSRPEIQRSAIARALRNKLRRRGATDASERTIATRSRNSCPC